MSALLAYSLTTIFGFVAFGLIAAVIAILLIPFKIQSKNAYAKIKEADAEVDRVKAQIEKEIKEKVESDQRYIKLKEKAEKKLSRSRWQVPCVKKERNNYHEEREWMNYLSDSELKEIEHISYMQGLDSLFDPRLKEAEKKAQDASEYWKKVR